MFKVLTRTLVVMIAALMILTAAPTPVLAVPQAGGAVQVEPPRPRRADNPPVLWSFAAAILIGAAVFLANAIPSKRGHQD